MGQFMRKAFVFDFDDTIATTDCRVIVRNGRAGYRALTPAQYNEHTLGANEVYDLSEFRKLINPVPKFLIHLTKEVHDEQHDVYILTARGGAAADAIRHFLSSHGIEAKEIICVGDSPKETHQAKQEELRRIDENYDRTYFWDDHIENVQAADAIGIKAYHIKKED